MPFEKEYAAHDFMKSLERSGYSIGQFVSANKSEQEEMFAVLMVNNPNQLKLDLTEEMTEEIFDEKDMEKRAKIFHDKEKAAKNLK